MRRSVAFVVALIALAAASGCSPAVGVTEMPMAAAVTQPQLVVEGAWVRTTTGSKEPRMTAVYLTISNPGVADVTLTSADCADAGLVQLHEMVMANGKLVMQEIRDGAAVPAGGHSHFVPGGSHIMLMMLKHKLVVGDQVALTLHFSDGDTLQVFAPVKEYSETKDHYQPPEPTSTASS